MSERRVRQALRDALNGDAETVAAPVRRGLLVLAVAQDDAEDRTAEFERRQTEQMDRVVETVDSMKKALYGTGAFVATTIITAAGAVITAIR